MDLSVIIPARNEIWLQRTIDDVLALARAETEVIVILDGDWPEQPLNDHPRLRVTHSQTVIGQRAATNLGARMSNATYVCKLDAHCSVADGFDVKLIEADKEIGRPDLTQIPAMFNLHAFNWKCQGCGHETYQGPTPTSCVMCAAKGTAGGPFERVVYWDLKAGAAKGRELRTEFWRFDADLHFQYDKERKRNPAASGELVDVMSSIGACFFMRRERFFEIGGLDEAHGSWGQYGTEIACKSWLSGGRHIVNKRTWFAHLFRTQGADFGFPYAQPGAAIGHARKYSQRLWFENRWPQQVHPLSWLLEKFAPVRGWHTPESEKETDADRQKREARLAAVIEKGKSFARVDRQTDAGQITRPSVVGDQRSTKLESAISGSVGADRPVSGPGVYLPGSGAPITKGLAFYSDCRGDKTILVAVREQLQRAAPNLPIVSATLGRIGMGRNFVPRLCANCGFIAWDATRLRRCRQCGAEKPPTAAADHGRALFNTLERGYVTMFRQQLAALEALDTDVAFLVEHDVLYHPSHFDFTPPRRDTFYYNQNTWRVNPANGQALFYYCNQVSGLCADRQLLVEHYRKRVEYVLAHGFDRSIGFEPGGNGRSRELFGAVPIETWMSPAPNVDIKTEFCLTPGRWSQDKFRNKSTCQGWTEADEIPGWGRTKDRFADFLAELTPAAREVA